MRVCVTGASGQAGRAVVAGLIEHGHYVVATDIVQHRDTDPVPILRADLTDYGQAVEAVGGCEAVIHLANIPAPGLAPPAVTFNQNITMNFNVFHAASQAGVARVVWASSETTLGLPFKVPPLYAPIDEDHYPLPTSTYALSKVASETTAAHIAQWSGIPFVALRFSNIFGPDDYQYLPESWDNPRARKWNLWGYIDERDAAQACRLALTAAVSGAPSFIIAAADTVMPQSSADLMRQVFPEVKLRGEVAGNTTLLAIGRARQQLGFEPRHSWRDHVPAP